MPHPSSRTAALRSGLDATGRDIRYALRLLRRTPLFTLTAIGTLAVAVAVNAAVFSVVDAALLKPLPYPQPDRLAAATRSTAAASAEPSSSVNGRTWLAMRDHLTAADAAVFSSWTTGVNMSSASAPSSVRFVQQQRTGAGFFEVLGVMSTILGLLALTAALLACAGVYGLIAASVAERTRELGIRLALGATRWQAIGSVARPGVGLSVAGVVLGSVSAYALSGVMRHLVWGISLTDPATFAMVAATALALAAAASLLPALRVRHLDPAETLRRD